jgi:hypothetical protein
MGGTQVLSMSSSPLCVALYGHELSTRAMAAALDGCGGGFMEAWSGLKERCWVEERGENGAIGGCVRGRRQSGPEDGLRLGGC